MPTVIKIPALRVQQSPGKVLFQFSIDGKQLERFATISRIRRNDEREIKGYQRPEALSHIASIRKYIESKSPMIPNAIVIAFTEEVKFVPTPGQSSDNIVRHGDLHIPALKDGEEGEVIGWIVDGQQRTAAIRAANVKSFPIPVTAFVATQESEQREQFILVNSVKPLSKSLIYELLPTTDTLLPAALARRRLSATVLDALNSHRKSPFWQRIQTPTNPEGNIKDNSVLRMLDNSITEGSLYEFRDAKTGDGDVRQMCELVNNFFSAVVDIFSEDWEHKPRRSRLVHGVGIIALGYLMDSIVDRLGGRSIPTVEKFSKEISRIADECHWSSGEWDFGGGIIRRWNELQNTSKDIQMLSNHILGIYRTTRR